MEKRYRKMQRKANGKIREIRDGQIYVGTSSTDSTSANGHS